MFLVWRAVVFLPRELILKSQRDCQLPGKASFSAFILSFEQIIGRWAFEYVVFGFCPMNGSIHAASVEKILLQDAWVQTIPIHAQTTLSCIILYRLLSQLCLSLLGWVLLEGLNLSWSLKSISDFYVFKYLCITVYGSNCHLCFCSMGFVRNPLAFLQVLQSVIQITGYRFIIFTAGYGPLDAAIWTIANESDSSEKQPLYEGISIFNGKLFCFSGWAQISQK